MGYFFREGNVLGWQENQQKLWLRPWGKNGLRVQCNLAGKILGLPQALLELPDESSQEVSIEIKDEAARIQHGILQAMISSSGRLRFVNAQTGQLLLEESIGNP